MSQSQNTYEQLSAPNAEMNAQVVVNPEQQPCRSQIKPRQRYKRLLYGFGLSEVVLGCLLFLLGAASLVYAGVNPTYEYSYDGAVYRYQYYYDFTYSSQGVWGGVFIVVCGILGVKTRNRPSVRMYNANMVLSIVTANVMGVVIILASTACDSTRYDLRPIIALHGIMAVFAFAGMVVCIVHSAYCCAGICCRSRQYQGTVTYAPQHYVQQPQQMVQLANGQYVMVSCQPMVATSYPVGPVVGGPVVFHSNPAHIAGPQMTLAPQAPPTFPTQQSAKEQEAQMQPAMQNPPLFNTLPNTQDPSV